jgi:alpha-glucosidase
MQTGVEEKTNKTKNRSVDTFWWQESVFYQIYPRSFFDANGDGIGDLRGIIEKLDYLNWLGIDVIWLSPIYKSPMADFGYDVSDFRSIDRTFGQMKDFNALLKEVHDRGMKLIMDMTFNHTSDQHPWFIESSSCKDNSKSDWYIWRDPKWGKRKPNNWKSTFGGDAWEWCEKRQQYYFHLYLNKQPDINWDCPEVRKAIFEECSFWLDKGVDGFRMDSAHMLVKRNLAQNNKLKLFGLYGWHAQKHDNFVDLKETHHVWQEFRAFLDKKYMDKMMVAEVDPGGLDGGKAETYYGNGENEFNLVFSFPITNQWWSAKNFSYAYENWIRKLQKTSWPALVMNNHDLMRVVGRYGNGQKGRSRAKVAAAMLMTLRATPFLYYGEELGMESINIPKNKIVDPVGKKFWPVMRGRDNARTPMQWNKKKFAGFSRKEPWLPISKDFSQINVEAESTDENSVLTFYRQLIELRKNSEILRKGKYLQVSAKDDVWIFVRFLGKEEIMVVLNFSDKKDGRNWPGKGYYPFQHKS